MFKHTPLILAGVHGFQNHPVREELVQEIKAKTNKWTPMEVGENHFRHVPVGEIKNTLGSLDASNGMLTKFDNPEKKEMSTSEALMDSLNGILNFGQGFGSIFGRSLRDDAGDEDDQSNWQDNYTLDDIPGKLKKTREDLRPKKEKITGDPRLPKMYNARDEYPHCKPEVLNQKICGACWAFSSAGILEDRFCIHSEGQIKVTLSPQDMVNCDFENFGCTGGYFVQAIDFLITEGVTTNQCLRYRNEKQECKFSCDNPKKHNYDKYYCKPGSLKIFTETSEIQREIYNNGPVMVGLMVYEDLYSYKSGVYEYTAGGLIGGHGIRCVGWGHDDDGFLYWICQNQWTDAWGNNGYVNIKAGEIGIDTWALSCMPDIIAEKK